MSTQFNKYAVKLLLVSFIGTMFQGCANSNSTTEDNIINATPVTITNVTSGPLNQYLELSATSVFQKKSIVRSIVTGFLTSVEINPGEKVSRGQLLFSVTTKEAAAIGENSLQNDSTFKFKGELYIKAPISGTVSSISHQRGDFVVEGDELASVAEQNSLVFNLQAPYELSGSVRVGMSCEIVLPDGRHLRGSIISILPSMNMQSQTLTLVVKPTDAQNIPENLIAQVNILKYSKSNVFTLPKESILTDETQTIFWVMKLIDDTTAVKVLIKRGIESKGLVEILEPTFSVSDRIIYSGNYGLEDTAKITIISR